MASKCDAFSLVDTDEHMSAMGTFSPVTVPVDPNDERMVYLGYSLTALGQKPL